MNEPLKGPTLSVADAAPIKAALDDLRDSVLTMPPDAQLQVMMPPSMPERVPASFDFRDAGASRDLDGLPVWLRVSAEESGVAGFCDELTSFDNPPPTLDLMPGLPDEIDLRTVWACVRRPPDYEPIVAHPVRVYRHLARIPATGKLCWLYTTEEPAPLNMTGIVVTKPAAPPPAP